MTAREELRRVESFDELRPLMTVVIGPCDCSDRHRGQLVESVTAANGERGFRLYPALACIPRPGRPPADRERVVGEIAVSSGLVFVVVDPALEHPDLYATIIKATEVVASGRAAVRKQMRERAR